MNLRRDVFKETEAEITEVALPDSVPLARFFSFARKLGVQTIVTDTPHDSLDIAEENEDLALYGRFCESHTVRRIVAFDREVRSIAEIGDLPEAAVLGVAVWKEDMGHRSDGSPEVCRRIFESVVRRGGELHNYSRNEPRRTIPYGPGLYLRITGHLFCQQNSITNVCAHAALRTVLDALGVEMSYRAINHIANVDHRQRKLHFNELEGLTTAEILKVLHAAGFETQYSEYHTDIPDDTVETIPWQDRIYGGAESGYPSLLIFGSKVTTSAPGKPKEFYHIMPVFGHTLNRDMWIPRAERAYYENTGFFSIGRFRGFQPSHLWLSAFVVHDDALGQNYCLPKFYLPPMKQLMPSPELPPGDAEAAKPQPYTWPYEAAFLTPGRHGSRNGNRHPVQEFDNGVAFVISVRPRGVKVDGAMVQRGALGLLHRLGERLQNGCEWSQRAYDALGHEELILRPLLLPVSGYLDHLAQADDWRESGPVVPSDWDSSEIRQYLPDDDALVWMVEFSIPELFPANLRKIGELLVHTDFDPDADRGYWCEGAGDPQCGLIVARVPGRFLLPHGMKGGADNASSTLVPFECVEISSPFSCHVSLFGAEISCQ